MNLRLALYTLAGEHRLSAGGTRRLQALAGLDGEPASLARWLPRGVALLGAALGGFGLILWVAANWGTFGRTGRFVLLQGFVLAMCAGALARPAARAPLSLLAFLGIGALFAYFGQTYQTGADPWQLFALWAVLALPLCFGARSDVVWAPWALVVMTGLGLWVGSRVDHRWWGVGSEVLHIHLIAWMLAGLVVAGLSRPLRQFTGAGIWALRTAATFTVTAIGFSALSGLFEHGGPPAPQYFLGLLLLALAAAGASRPRAFDVYVLSVVALGLDTLLICGLARLLFAGLNGGRDDFLILLLLILGLAAAGLLAGTVSLILRLTRAHAAAGVDA